MAQERVGFRPSFFESNPSAKSGKFVARPRSHPRSRGGSLSRDLSLRSSVVKTIFENGTAIEFARASTEWTQLETTVKNLRKMQ